ncbi:MFS transporter [Caballeronia arationis]|uniref:MFS transporter n=1 Tax=Caballeronia arationis TaxID=1777142 RepID=UPI002E1316C8|nr:MFS transporter [Caballeronia arationis]
MALIASVLLFGAATCTIGFATNLSGIAALRFIAGLGIGGAMPIATTITSEFTPARSRTIAITATCICVPLGGMLAGVFASIVLPLYGWRSLFFIGGTLPLGCGLLLLRVLPETPRFLARKIHRWPELRKLLSRMDTPTEESTIFSDSREQIAEKRAGYGALFEVTLIRDTLAIWTAFFMCLLAVYSAFSWLPTMLAAEGLPSGVGGAGLTAYNFGAAIGGLCCAIAIARFGSRWPMAIAAGGAAASAFLLHGVNVGKYTGLFIFGLGVHGMLVSAIQCTLYAVCAHVYTTSVRATGTASALAFGRIGSILSAFLGAMVITAGGASAFLSLLGSAMLCVTVALLVIKRHIPSLKDKRLLNSQWVVSRVNDGRDPGEAHP